MRHLLVALAWVTFAAAAVLIVQAALGSGSVLPAALVLYAGTVSYGLSAMAELRERVLFGPARQDPAPSWPRWWIPRVILVLVVGALPAALVLGGLPGH